ncbi:MAG: sulfotransferase family protein [Alphaproteobacteria bacterium]
MRRGWRFNGCCSNGERKDRNERHINGSQPDFLCVGLHKGGTTWLYQQLDSHPDFWMPPVKELHYFDQLGRVKRSSSPRMRDERDLQFLENMESLGAKPYMDLEHYARLFEPKGPLLSGDISPNYSALSDEIVQRIVRYFPNLKVIFLARDPVERVWSHLSMEVHYQQIETFDVTDVDQVNRNLLRRGMLLRSYPSAIAARWRRHVHPDRFRIYFFDDLQRNPTELRRSILDFLGADPNKAANWETAKRNGWAKMDKLVLTDKVRLHLARFFKKELKACATRLGGPARNWPARYGFSLLVLFAQLLDNLDILFRADWIA